MVKAYLYPRIKEHTQSSYNCAYKHLNRLYDKQFAKIRIGDLQSAIRDIHDNGAGYSTQKKARQIYKLFRASNNRYAKMILMHMMLGTRPSEFLAIEKTDVKLRQRYLIIRESKTEAGRNRIIPLHKQTLPFWIEFLAENNKFIACDEHGIHLNYSRNLEQNLIKHFELNIKYHTPHECRHTLASLLNNVGANITASKRILGHASNDITEKHYTHKDLINYYIPLFSKVEHGTNTVI